MKVIARLFSAVVFALLFVACIFALIAALFGIVDWIFGQQFSPRGAGWGIMLIAGAIAGWKIGYKIPDNMDLVLELAKWATASKFGRMLIVASATWVVSWTIYCIYNLRPADYYCYADCGWGEREWTTYISVVFGAPVGMMLCYLVIRWIKAGK